MMFYFLYFVLISGILFLIGLRISENHYYGFWVPYTIVSVFFIWFINITMDSSRWLNRLLFIVLIPVLGFILGRNILLTQERMERAIYPKAELRLVGEWYSQNSKEGEKIVVTEPRVAGYYADQMSYATDSSIRHSKLGSAHYTDHHGNFVFLGSFEASSYESFIIELQNKGITYVVWNSHHGKYSPDVYHYKIGKIFLISELSDARDRLNFKLIKTIKVGSRYAFIYKFVS